MSNKFIPSIVVAIFVSVLIVSVPSFVFAQSINQGVSTLDLKKQIESLLSLIQTLQTQLNAIRGELGVESITQTASSIISIPEFSRDLSIGSRGDDVQKLQEFLAQDKAIYPEGLITGYFGRLTEVAVKKWQTKQGIEAIGIIGPKTRTRLSELVSEGAGRSGIIPPGLLIAPGLHREGTTTPSGTIPATPAQPIGQTGTTTIPAIPATPARPSATSTPPIVVEPVIECTAVDFEDDPQVGSNFTGNPSHIAWLNAKGLDITGTPSGYVWSTKMSGGAGKSGVVVGFAAPYFTEQDQGISDDEVLTVQFINRPLKTVSVTVASTPSSEAMINNKYSTVVMEAFNETGVLVGTTTKTFTGVTNGVYTPWFMTVSASSTSPEGATIKKITLKATTYPYGGVWIEKIESCAPAVVSLSSVTTTSVVATSTVTSMTMSTATTTTTVPSTTTTTTTTTTTPTSTTATTSITATTATTTTATSTTTASTTTTTYASNDAVRILSPNGGEQWTKGQTYEVRWENPLQAGFSNASYFHWEVYFQNGNSGYGSTCGSVPITQSSCQVALTNINIPDSSNFKAGITLGRSCPSGSPDSCYYISVPLAPGKDTDYSDDTFTIVSPVLDSTTTGCTSVDFEDDTSVGSNITANSSHTSWLMEKGLSLTGPYGFTYTTRLSGGAGSSGVVVGFASPNFSEQDGGISDDEAVNAVFTTLAKTVSVTLASTPSSEAIINNQSSTVVMEAFNGNGVLVGSASKTFTGVTNGVYTPAFLSLPVLPDAVISRVTLKATAHPYGGVWLEKIQFGTSCAISSNVNTGTISLASASETMNQIFSSLRAILEEFKNLKQ